MKYKILSDTHGRNLPEQDFFDGVLFLAGDVHEVKKFSSYKNIIQGLCNQNKMVIMTPGNHEYYGSNITKVHRQLKELQDEIPNFFVLLNETMVVDDVTIIGCTLWTDFDNGNPLSLYYAKLNMNDYKHIRNGPADYYWRHKLRVEEVQMMHHTSKKFIENELYKIPNDGKVLVMTHHAPSFKSIPNRYLTDVLNGCYSSNLEDMIHGLEPDVWIHGHIHESKDYFIHNTRILCNPMGYDAFENKSFDANIEYVL